jgi:hypothetical protein
LASIFDSMREVAQQIAEGAQANIVRLDQRLADIEKQKAEIEAQIQDARGALKRAADFPVKLGADYLCPVCWTDDAVTSTLRNVPSPDRRDIYRCNICHFETAF